MDDPDGSSEERDGKSPPPPSKKLISPAMFKFDKFSKIRVCKIILFTINNQFIILYVITRLSDGKVI